jgi:hypothetical protein
VIVLYTYTYTHTHTHTHTYHFLELSHSTVESLKAFSCCSHSSQVHDRDITRQYIIIIHHCNTRDIVISHLSEGGQCLVRLLHGDHASTEVLMAFCNLLMYVCMYVCMHVCMYVFRHVCMYACMYVLCVRKVITYRDFLEAIKLVCVLSDHRDTHALRHDT